MAKIILISGLVGAGKSTYARELETSIGAIRFSIDEWMSTLFSADQVGEIEYEWAMERIGRIERQIWSMAEKLLKLDIPAILDLGLLQREHRQKFYDLAKAQNFQIETHLIEADKAIRWKRVQTRNKEKGETFSLEVNSEMFEFCEGLYEHPDKDEAKMCKFIRTDR
ncbi:MAG: ATP-binding protein [Kordiimonadaceae bacterium]|jgi:predicted kinase|nr:ATP-binding protein [Kordiimonadaceae bacterium]MBT6036739.1 ATP-binding protein [Kordiimonadaceae bacterium]MBT7583808.1 ATP-binding protein [Kordiimonadaceae bacterium]